MRIAILTQPLRTNYGGILQNYALQQCLKRMGHEVFTLDNVSPMNFNLRKFIRRAGKIMLGKVPPCYLFYESRYNKDYKFFTRHTRTFVDRHITLFPYRDLAAELSPESFDAYIIGSDQVWRPEFNDIGRMFLDFAREWNVRRLAYAASFGVDEWEYSPKETELCSALAKKFDAVSVREESGIRLCEDYLGVPAVKVLDPTMLLSGKDYAALVDMDKTTPCEGQLFVHVLDRTPEKLDVIRRLAEKYGVKPFTCNQSEPEVWIEFPLEKRIQPPVEQWLRSFIEAEYVVTDSFHATVFAILFGKKFLVLDNPGRGLARIQSLLGAFGLEKCLFTGGEALNFPEIDYLCRFDILEKLRQDSTAFLRNNLE